LKWPLKVLAGNIDQNGGRRQVPYELLGLPYHFFIYAGVYGAFTGFQLIPLQYKNSAMISG
jgi:hypothetical protein